MSHTPEVQDINVVDYQGQARQFYFAIPFYLAVPVGFIVAFQLSGVPFHLSAFGLGVLGWIVALMLRGPFAVLVKNLPEQRAKNIVGSLSGPLEESVRVLLLILTGASFGWATSLGQGWAAIEVLFAVINGVVISVIVNRTDEKAMQARAILESQGNLNESSILGVVERISASGFHIGSTLLIAFHWWMFIPMMVIHSGFNLVTVRLAKKSGKIAEGFAGIVGLIVFLAGIYTFA